jgi:hypothetical protein
MTLLTTSKYKQIELVGLVSHMCVLANAVISQTASPNTPIVVYRHLTASFNSKLHQQALNVLKHLHISIK